MKKETYSYVIGACSVDLVKLERYCHFACYELWIRISSLQPSFYVFTIIIHRDHCAVMWRLYRTLPLHFARAHTVVQTSFLHVYASHLEHFLFLSFRWRPHRRTTLLTLALPRTENHGAHRSVYSNATSTRHDSIGILRWVLLLSVLSPWTYPELVNATFFPA